MMMIMGTLISMSSNSWFSMWIGLELNLIGFIKIMMKNKSSYLIECSMKYFIIQIFSSFLFVTMMLEMINIFYFKMNIIIIIVNLMMMMKMGLSPLHFWLINMFNLLPLKMIMILMTWQKLIPLWLMSIFMPKKIFLLMIIWLNLTISVLGLINQTNLKKLFLYSSLNHNSWMLSTMLVNKYWWVNYMIGYSIILMPLYYIMNKGNLSNMINMYMNKMSYWMKNIIILNLMSMGGLPPFLGFIMKWYLIMKLNLYLTMMFMLIMTSINIFIYLKLMTYSILMFKNNFKIKWWINIYWLPMIWIFI